MSIELPAKHPGDRVDYPIDWVNLLVTGETITAAASTVESGLTESSPAGLPPISESLTTIMLSGGTEGETYRVTIQITTDQGSPVRIYKRDFFLEVKAL